MNFTKIQPYLPSKKFQKVFGFIILIVVLFIGINFLISRKESFQNKDSLAINNKTIYQIRDTDTDYDGIADWEEKFWGTDPNNKFSFEGMSDAEYIQNKRKALNSEGEIDIQSINETDKFAQEFFSTFFALQNTNGVNEQDVLNFSQALGANIVNQEIPDSYELSQVNTTENSSSENQINYYLNMKRLFESYQNKGLGDELAITSENLVSYTNQYKANTINELLLIGDTYIEFTKKAMEITVPINLAQYHLDIVNSANNTGKSVIDMSKVIGDPIVGLSAVANYQKYSQELVNSVEKLEEELQKVL